MSLASLAIRLATIRALKGRTFAEDRVFDSAIQPIDLVAADTKQSVIIVTTDDDDATVEGRDLIATDHQLELVIEVAVASKHTVQVGEGETAEALTIPATDAGLEASLNLIGWQIARALSADGGEWGDLWRMMVSRVHTITSRRGADDDNGVRYAARQYVYKIDHVADPEPGADPVYVWARAIAMLKADQQFEAYGKIIEATITADQPEPWERVRASLGLADDASDWIADKPLVDDADPLSAVEIEGGFTVDAEKAEAADGPEQ